MNHTIVKILRVINCVTVFTSLEAFWSTTSLRARWTLTSCVMLTSRNNVWLATLFVRGRRIIIECTSKQQYWHELRTPYLTWVVIASSDNTFLDPVTPSSSRKAPITSKATSVTATDQVFSREMSIYFSLWVNADTIWHGLYSSKSLE